MAVFEIWKPRDLYRLQQDTRLEALPSHFLDTYFTERHFSAEKAIRMAELDTPDRRMAPFVLPTENGKPIFRERGATVKEIEPAYIKPKDAVRVVDARNPTVSELLMDQPLSLQQRFDMATAKRAAYQLRTIRMRECWMAARAFIDAKVNIAYERDQGAAFPEVEVDFDRDAGHTVVKGSNYWSSTSTLILDDIETWANTMVEAKFGGWPTRLYLGSEVAKFFHKNTQVQDDLVASQVRRGTETDLTTGIQMRAGKSNPLVRIGTVGKGIEVVSYRDQVENANGSMVDLLDPKDVLLVADGATGTRAYGAIYDLDALQDGRAISTDIYTKMWQTVGDLADSYVMSQSAPLMIPLYPNRTFKATVLA